MDFPPLLALLARWAHILAAITALGGSIFLRFVLMPAAGAALSDADNGRLRQALMPRWRAVIHVCIALFLASGLYNYLAITRFEHVDHALYHALFGVKFLLALGVFYLATALTSLGQAYAAIKADRARFMALLVALAVAIVLISGLLKTMPKRPAPAPAVQVTPED